MTDSLSLAARTAIQDCLDRIQPKSLQVMNSFYPVLFDRHPDIKAAFIRQGSEESLNEIADRTVVAWLEFFSSMTGDASTASRTLAGFRKGHERYGATPEQVEQMLRLFIETVARFDAADWTPELESAWGELEELVCQHKDTPQRVAV